MLNAVALEKLTDLLRRERNKIMARSGPASLSLAAMEGFNGAVDALTIALKADDASFDLGKFVGAITDITKLS